MLSHLGHVIVATADLAVAERTLSALLGRSTSYTIWSDRLHSQDSCSVVSSEDGAVRPITAGCRPRAVEPHAKAPIMEEGITYVGLDAHQETIHAAVLVPGIERAAEDAFSNTPEAVRRWARRLVKQGPAAVRCCYEAGPLGYGLLRELEALGLACIVVAPSLIPVRPGDRIKTDRRH